MRHLIEIDVLANVVSMLRASTRGAIWLPDDEEEARFYERCAHPDGVVIAAEGSALGLWHLIERRGVRGVVAVVRGSEIAAFEHDSVFCPDVGDVASLLVRSSAFDDVISDVAGAAWSKAFASTLGSVKFAAVQIASILTAARSWATEHVQPHPTDTELWATVDWETCEVQLEKLRLACQGWSPHEDKLKPLKSADTFLSAIKACDGMDVIEVISRILTETKPHGIQAKHAASSRELLDRLRVAFTPAELENDGIYWRMRRWERLNHSYPLLRSWRSLDALGVVCDQRYWDSDLDAFFTSSALAPSLGLIKLDLDNFKNVNTQLGHAGGDEAIKAYCLCVRSTLGQHAEVYRRGGDEVIAIVPDATIGQLTQLSETTRSSIEELFKAWCEQRDLTPAVTASIGATLLRRGEGKDELIARIDALQTLAKNNGKNRCEVSE